MRLITYLRLVPWLKMSRAMPLLPLLAYAFRVWIRTAVPLPFPFPLDLPILKVACAVHAGLLDEFQHVIRLNPQSWHILEAERESLSTQLTVNWLLATASIVMRWTIFVVSSHECRYTTASAFYSCEDSYCGLCMLWNSVFGLMDKMLQHCVLMQKTDSMK